jgi:hypothetical protein
LWRSQSCSVNLQRIFEKNLDVTAKSPHFRNPKFESYGHRSQRGRSDLNTTVVWYVSAPNGFPSNLYCCHTHTVKSEIWVWWKWRDR